jgi:hypothetical protein
MINDISIPVIWHDYIWHVKCINITVALCCQNDKDAKHPCSA